MTNAELIQKIRAEIERLKGYYRITNPYDKRAIRVCENLLSFLDTLESEKQMNQEGLEEEYKDYIESDLVYSKLVNRNAGLSIARHFAKWGAEHLKK